MFETWHSPTGSTRILFAGNLMDTLLKAVIIFAMLATEATFILGTLKATSTMRAVEAIFKSDQILSK